MSYQTWHNYGYGIKTNLLEVDSVERMEKLLAHAPKYQQKIHDYFAECEIDKPTIEDYYEFAEYYRYDLAGILSQVIEEAEGLCFLSCDDEDCNYYLMYPPIYPWNMSEEDKEMTIEKVKAIIIKYASIVTDSFLDFDYQEAENFG